MRVPSASLLYLLSLLLIAVAAWDKDDYEIFQLRDELVTIDGQNATFYSFLGVSPSATTEEIKSAVRKKSKRLHPDKAIPSMIAQREREQLFKSRPKSADKNKKPGVHVQKGLSQKERNKIALEANYRYERIPRVRDILADARRERYDYFLKNGFPVWRGTGYYYSRFRPGIGSVLVGMLVMFGGVAHYGAMYIGWKRQRDFVQRYISHARRTAWGNEISSAGVPGMSDGGLASGAQGQTYFQEDDGPVAMNRRQKRLQEKESRKKENGKAVATARSKGISRPVDAEIISGPQGSKKKVVAENGKVLIVDSVGNVYLEEQTEEGDVHEYLLDPDEIPPPNVYQTALFRLPIWTFHQTIGRVIDRVRGTSVNADEPFLDSDGQQLTVGANPATDSDNFVDGVTAQNKHEEIRKRKAKARR